MAYETTDQLVALLSDRWYKEPDGNLYKLVNTFNAPLETKSDVEDKIAQWREINEAEGTTLDMLGGDRKAYRPSSSDDPYRFLIYIKSLMARAQGTAPSIVHIAGTALQNTEGFKIIRTGVRHVAISIPFSMLISLNMQKFILENLQKLLALGIWLDYIEMPMQTSQTQYIGLASMDDTTEYVNFGHAEWWHGWSGASTSTVYMGAISTIEENYDLGTAK